MSYIRSIPQSPSGGSIYGIAQRYSVDLESGRWTLAGPIAGAVVVASSGERRFEAVTGADGSYSLSALPSGYGLGIRVAIGADLMVDPEDTFEVSQTLARAIECFRFHNNSESVAWARRQIVSYPASGGFFFFHGPESAGRFGELGETAVLKRLTAELMERQVIQPA